MRRRALLFAAALGVGGTGLAGCGNSAGALGHEACVEVRASLRLYAQAVAATDPTTKHRLTAEASARLRDALQPAALAGSESGDWQALEITLSESNRVGEGTLASALTAQCSATLGSN